MSCYKDGIVYICFYIIKKLFISKLKVEFSVQIYICMYHHKEIVYFKVKGGVFSRN
jgi:hypothetical protein